jgi:hypothetical protein
MTPDLGVFIDRVIVPRSFERFLREQQAAAQSPVVSGPIFRLPRLESKMSVMRVAYYSGYALLAGLRAALLWLETLRACHHAACAR